MNIIDISMYMVIIAGLLYGAYLVIGQPKTNIPVIVNSSGPTDTTIPYILAYTPTLAVMGEAGINYNTTGSITPVFKMGGHASELPKNWGTPTGNEWVRCQVVTGVLDVGVTERWIKLDSDQYWAVTLPNTIAQKETVVILEVASDNTGSTILSSLKVTLKTTR